MNPLFFPDKARLAWLKAGPSFARNNAAPKGGVKEESASGSITQTTSARLNIKYHRNWMVSESWSRSWAGV